MVPKRALIAVVHAIQVIIYECPSHGKTYQELGHDYFDRAQKRVLTERYARKLHELGYQVNLTAKQDAA